MDFLKKYTKTGIAILCGIFATLMGFFAVAYTGLGAFNAFHLLNFDNALFIITGIVGIIGIVWGVISLVGVAYSILKKPLNFDLVPIISIAIALTYMILGIIVAEGLPTLCFIPFILQAIFITCYYISDKVFKK